MSDSRWLEKLLNKAWIRAGQLINEQAQSFTDSLNRWMKLNWPTLMLPDWEVRFNNFLRDARYSGITLEPESAQQVFAYLQGESERMRREGVRPPDPLPSWLALLLPTREQVVRPADERRFPDDLPAPFDPAHPQLRRLGNSIMQSSPPGQWLDHARRALKFYRVPLEIHREFADWIERERNRHAFAGRRDSERAPMLAAATERIAKGARPAPADAVEIAQAPTDQPGTQPPLATIPKGPAASTDVYPNPFGKWTRNEKQAGAPPFTIGNDAEFAKQVRAHLIAQIPSSILAALQGGSVKIIVLKDLGKQSKSDILGFYDPVVGILYVPESLPHNQPNSNPDRAIRHEVGHAFDHMLNFSTSNEFMRVYLNEQDSQQQKIKQAPRLKSGLGQFVVVAGFAKTLHQAASESFAEAFAIATRSDNTAESTTQRQFEEAFPKTVAIVKKLVEEWRQRDAKPAR